MAYNNGFPINYHQAYFPQVQAQPQQVNSGIIWVQGEASAKSYPVAPNSSVPLWDSEANVIYIKSADMSGMPSLKVLDYTIRDNQAKSVEPIPSMEFATKKELDSLKGEINSLRSKLEHMGRGKEKNDGK